MNDMRGSPGRKHSDSLTLVGPASFKRLLDGAPCLDARARRVALEARARPRDPQMTLGSHLIDRRARRGVRMALIGVVGRGGRIFPREHERRRPAHAPYE